MAILPVELAEEIVRLREKAEARLTAVTCNGDPRFHAILTELGLLHDKKQADYGRGADPLANIRASVEWGIPPWVGALVRLNDKVHRLKSLRLNGKLANESAIDSLNDIAVYAILARILLEEAQQAGAPPLPASRPLP